MEQNLVIEVNISDYILTPLSCASLVEQFLKSLLYQKSQIPYPYTWLKSSVNRRRNRVNVTEGIQSNGTYQFKIENQYRIASKLYDGLEDIMNELAKELSKNTVSEIFILFGPTPLCPKEVCRIKIPILAAGHFEEAHVKDALKYQHNALRQIFMSNSWMDSIDSSIPCTNTFIFITKLQDDGSQMTLLKACQPLNFQKNVKQYTIKVNWDSLQNYACCKIFDDSNEPTEYEVIANSTEQTERNIMWYQFDHSLEGYKNIYINGKGVSELW
ncbi:uncharacterized protein LOC123306412 [Coccinella septempunctata]|uniref:uncharacterized protein LOC123306412 n=1 Tax=Coccinella septempunctata TaxID=41139 RepID=UPI001D08C706|nr:uncharacterized protein LOC123306412 [Coccinella septempunctata]